MVAARNQIREAWESVWRRRDLRPIYEWARDFLSLSAPLTITGPFDVGLSRHFIGPFGALQDDHVREVNVLKPVRGGGTLIADVWFPWTRENDPGPFMFLLQTDPIADDHFVKVLSPTMNSVESVRGLLDALPRDAKTIRKIEFSDGNHLHINGPSIGNLQTNAFRYLVEDECWLYPDKMADAEGRTGDYARAHTSKIFRVSQGGPKERLELDHCAWNRAYNRGTIYEWEVECPLCAQLYDPVFSGVRDDGSFWGITWDHHRLPNGDWDLPKCVPTSRFECPHCREFVPDNSKTKAHWNKTGDYRRGAIGAIDVLSFHWEAVIADLWTGLVELWLDACNAERRGDLRPKLQFYQKRRAMMKDEAALMRSGMAFTKVAYEIKSDWAEERARFLTADRQEEDLYWVTVRAWANEKTRKLWFGKVYGESGIKDVQEKWKVPAQRVGIDSAFMPKGDRGVYAMCIRNGWLALRGDDKYEFPHRKVKHGNSYIVRKSYAPLSYGDAESGVARGRYCNLVLFSKDQMNQVVQTLIDSGRWEEPQATADPEMELEYAAQMSARIKVTDFDKRTGAQKTFWKESKNDHARDLANMQVLFAVLADLLPDPVMERLTKTEKEQPT